MSTYYVTIKEIGKRCPITTSYTFCGNVTEEQIIEFFGLKEPDVEWFKITLKRKIGVRP